MPSSDRRPNFVTAHIGKKRWASHLIVDEDDGMFIHIRFSSRGKPRVDVTTGKESPHGLGSVVLDE